MAEVNEASFALETYSNYVRAWELAIKREYQGVSEPVEIGIRRRQESLPSFKKLQGGGQSSRQLASELCRAKLTLKAMDSLPVDNFPELAPTASLWLPVQAYYAINAMGNAVFIALGGPVPGTHRAFRKSFSQNIIRFLPFPLDALCCGGPIKVDFTFKGIMTSPDEIRLLSQLEDPKLSEGHRFIGKSLSTTRERALHESYEEVRKKKKIQPRRTRANLTQKDRLDKYQDLHDTSIADFLYRMRIRANYDSSEMYIEAFNNVQDAVRHYRSLLYLTTVLVNGLQAIISVKIGQQNMSELEARLPS